MREIERRTTMNRRVVLRGGALAVAGSAAIGLTPDAAWAQAAKNLKPEVMATLARAARDIYPHDRIGDSFYITAVSAYDAGKPELRDLVSKGCATLDAEAKKRHNRTYLGVPDEADRVAILKSIESSAFFGKLRSDLVVSLYNQKAIWAKFGYEGSSADKGGYINRGFNDIDWLA